MIPRSGSMAVGVLALALPVLAAAALPGCSHKMRMPPEHLHMRPLDGGGEANARFIVLATLEEPPGEGFSFEREPLIAEDRIALAYRMERPRERGGIEGVGYGVGVWDAPTGRLITAVEMPTPWPEEVSNAATVAGLFPSHDVVATLREARLQFWEISSGRLVSTVVISEESPFEHLERTERGWSSSRTSAAGCSMLTMLPGGTRARAWVPHRSAWITWEVASGAEVGQEQGEAPSIEYSRRCGDLHLTEGMVLRGPRGSGRCSHVESSSPDPFCRSSAATAGGWRSSFKRRPICSTSPRM